MYDRTTNSLWHSLTGEPVVGQLANSGVVLERYPVTVTAWQEWLEQHPDTTVVDIDTGFSRRYFDPSEEGSAYFEYRASPEAMFPTFGVDPRVPEKSNVVGLAFDGESRAYPLDTIFLERVINDSIGGLNMVVIGHPQTGVLGVFERGDTKFTSGSDPREVIDESGISWWAGDDELIADDGRAFPRIPAREMFWFAWAAFFPGTDVYR